MDTEFIKSISSLGVGAVFALTVFTMHLRDTHNWRWQMQRTFDSLREDKMLAETRFGEIVKQDIATREASTEVLQKLVVVMDKIDGEWVRETSRVATEMARTDAVLSQREQEVRRREMELARREA